MKNIYRISLLLFLINGTIVLAQDPHLSQYNASPILLNPANTGIIEKGDFRIGANYRTQWGSISSSGFNTTAISFDTKHKDRWGVGFYAINNELSSFINTFNFMLSGSYQITDPTQKKYIITTGIQLGIMMKKIDEKEFIYDSQYENGNFNEDNPSGEFFNRSNSISPDFNWGIAYVNTDKNWELKPFAGISASHLSMSKESFANGDKDNLPIRWAFNGGAKYSVNKKLNVNFRSLLMLQRTAKEINFGALAHYNINETEYTLIGGIDVRWNDALIFNIGVNHKNIVYRISYDYTTSSLHNANKGRGGTEISIIYSPRKFLSSPSIQ